MLVRARRLVWERMSDTWHIARSCLGEYSARISDSAAFTGYKCVYPSGRWDGTTSLSLAQDLAQSHFNSAWLSNTEVMPLEWIDNAEDCSIGSSQTGTYYVELGVNSKDYWIWDAPGTKAERCDSREHGKQLCEAHHRKIVLGE